MSLTLRDKRKSSTSRYSSERRHTVWGGRGYKKYDAWNGFCFYVISTKYVAWRRNAELVLIRERRFPPSPFEIDEQISIKFGIRPSTISCRANLLLFPIVAIWLLPRVSIHYPKWTQSRGKRCTTSDRFKISNFHLKLLHVIYRQYLTKQNGTYAGSSVHVARKVRQGMSAEFS